MNPPEEGTMTYSLITPLRNEAHNMTQLYEAVTQQTLPPERWVLIDSGSTDATPRIANRWAQEHDPIETITQTRFHDDGHTHENFALAINTGLQHLLQTTNSSPSYIGKTDAPIQLSPDYFETLLTTLEEDPRAPFACGIQTVQTPQGTQRKGREGQPESLDVNDIRLYRSTFLETMGGYPLTPAPDAVLHIHARNQQTPPRVVQQARFTKTRPDGSKTGRWAGQRAKGRYMYQLGYHPLLALGNAAYVALHDPPHTQWAPMMWGYAKAWAQRADRIDDATVRRYYGHERLKEVTHEFLAREKAEPHQ